MSDFLEGYITAVEGYILDVQGTVLQQVTVPLGARHEAAYWLRGAQKELQDVDDSTQRYLDAIRRTQAANTALVEEVTTLEVYRLEAAKRQRVVERVASATVTRSKVISDLPEPATSLKEMHLWLRWR